jgi:hypothetical protein
MVSWLPLSSRCFATSGIDVGFFGERLPSSLKEIWLTPPAGYHDQKQNSHE